MKTLNKFKTNKFIHLINDHDRNDKLTSYHRM